MSDIVVRVENLGKRYRIGQRERYKALREVVTDAMYTPFRRLSSFGQCLSMDGGGRRSRTNEWIWALKHISFDVKRGEVLGIIGCNGAGKSTTLKILSRITVPTEGYAEIHGRVGSLLEVGTGFHYELTGRENIFLNGAILGMSKREIDRKFDEIVAFAEVEEFLDTPVKRYSSGMYMRLAFAVAAHLEPEILVVDEVLAVGDAPFQKKCLGKMGDVAREGRTVLFVSHNMVAVRSLCQRAIWLHDGEIQEQGESAQVVSHYLQSHSSQLTEQVWSDLATAPGNEMVRLHRVRVQPENGLPSDPITMQTPLHIEVEFWNLVPDAHLSITLYLITEEQVTAFSTGSEDAPAWHDGPLPQGLFRSVCCIPGNLLNGGLYHVSLRVVKDLSRVVYRHDAPLSFEVLDLSERSEGYYGKEPGVIAPMLVWTTECIDWNLAQSRSGVPMK